MRDDRNKWAPFTADFDIQINESTKLKQIEGLQLTMISGPKVRDQLDVPIIGWPGVATTAVYAVCMRRDRVLLVGGDPIQDGWYEETSQAVSNFSGGYDVFDLSGEGALAVLQRGAELDLKQPSASVVRLAFGLGLHIYRFEQEQTYRLHVLSNQREALLGHLKAAG